MEALGIAIQLGFLAALVAIPIIGATKGYGFVRINAVSLPLICFLIALIAYWPHFYSDLRLELMGFDFDGMSDAERSRNVLPAMREEATALYWSNMGIGWPLKAIFGIVLFAPYPTVVWGCGVLVKHIRRKRNSEIT